MSKKNLIKKISLGIASLALICPLAMGSISNGTHANAEDENVEFTKLAHILGVNPHRNFHKYYHGNYYKTRGMFLYVNGHEMRYNKAIRIAKYSRRSHHRHYYRKARVRHHAKRRARRTRRYRKHRSHRQARKQYILVSRKSHKARRHHVNYNNYYDNNYANDDSDSNNDSTEVAPAPSINDAPSIDDTESPENTEAQWYKDNSGRLYASENGAGTDFNLGWGDSTVSNPYIESDYLDDEQYKHGWIAGASLNLNNNTSSLNGSDNDIINALNSQPKSYYAHAINVWNSGHHHAVENSDDDSFLYYNGNNSWTDQ